MADGLVRGHIEDVPNHVTDLSDGGKCTECGGCCGSMLPVTKEEIRRIRKYVEENGIKPYVDRGPWSRVEFDLTCPFLDRSKKDHKCRIYEVRPFICRYFTCYKKITMLDSVKVRNHYAKGGVEIVNMREMFG